MTNKEADEANHKKYRNEKCDRAGKCDDYIGWHCTGCNAAKNENDEKTDSGLMEETE